MIIFTSILFCHSSLYQTYKCSQSKRLLSNELRYLPLGSSSKIYLAVGLSLLSAREELFEKFERCGTNPITAIGSSPLQRSHCRCKAGRLLGGIVQYSRCEPPCLTTASAASSVLPRIAVFGLNWKSVLLLPAVTMRPFAALRHGVLPRCS
jgi:hypothetical protein